MELSPAGAVCLHPSGCGTPGWFLSLQDCDMAAQRPPVPYLCSPRNSSPHFSPLIPEENSREVYQAA